jgi:hypothetical protein
MSLYRNVGGVCVLYTAAKQTNTFLSNKDNREILLFHQKVSGKNICSIKEEAKNKIWEDTFFRGSK